MTETKLRDEIAELGKSLYDRGLTFGSTGNLSVQLDDGFLMTPTGTGLGKLDPAKISKISEKGQLLSGDPPTKEKFLHQVMYKCRSKVGAVVHLHSTHSVAVSCMEEIDTSNVLPPLTAYYVMRIGQLPLIPYFPPGDLNLAKAVREMASNHHAVLLANHGPVVAGKNLTDAVFATEELEETAKLFILLRNLKTKQLTTDEVLEIKRKFPNNY